MIVLFGTRTYREVLAVVTLLCRYCGNSAAHRVEKLTTKFTLFFLPLFTVTRRYTVQCATCAETSRIDKNEAELLAR